MEDVLSWSSGASIEWKRMHQDCNRVEVDASGLTFEEWDPTQHVDTDLNKTLKRSVRSLTGAGRGGHLAQISAGYKS